MVEQNCIYHELDGLDTLSDTLHIVGHLNDQPHEVVVYARAMAPSKATQSICIGRVVSHADYRGKGLARETMLRLISASEDVWPEQDIFLSAQANVVEFYESLGFDKTSSEYLEDGIAHVDMIKHVAA